MRNQPEDQATLKAWAGLPYLGSDLGIMPVVVAGASFAPSTRGAWYGSMNAVATDISAVGIGVAGPPNAPENFGILIHDLWLSTGDSNLDVGMTMPFSGWASADPWSTGDSATPVQTGVFAVTDSRVAGIPFAVTNVSGLLINSVGTWQRVPGEWIISDDAAFAVKGTNVNRAVRAVATVETIIVP